MRFGRKSEDLRCGFGAKLVDGVNYPKGGAGARGLFRHQGANSEPGIAGSAYAFPRPV
jgi:hypothetical protein